MDRPSGWTIDVTQKQDRLKVPDELLRRAVVEVLRGEGVERAEVSVVVVDDAAIHALNRQFLDHDYPTDVLSFPMGEGPELDGEVIVSAETAQRRCGEFGWSAACELLWYVLHGTLHLCGYDDRTPEQKEGMERLQRLYLQRLEKDPALPAGCKPAV